jgi:phospholipid/cholesterol/gamma-HCH transport system ATP-binding protein
VLAEKRVIAVGSLAEIERFDHPWVQEYFNGPRGRAARDSQHNFAKSL